MGLPRGFGGNFVKSRNKRQGEFGGVSEKVGAFSWDFFNTVDSECRVEVSALFPQPWPSFRISQDFPLHNYLFSNVYMELMSVLLLPNPPPALPNQLILNINYN